VTVVTSNFQCDLLILREPAVTVSVQPGQYAQGSVIKVKDQRDVWINKVCVCWSVLEEIIMRACH
jgi:hypothetical protein